MLNLIILLSVSFVALIELYALCLATYYSGLSVPGVYVDKYGIVKAYRSPDGKDGTSKFMFWHVYSRTSLIAHSGYVMLGSVKRKLYVYRPCLGISALFAASGYVLGFTAIECFTLALASSSMYLTGFCVVIGAMKYKAEREYFANICKTFQEVYATEIAQPLPSQPN